jgi:predicted protein tyrosine phosphatase
MFKIQVCDAASALIKIKTEFPTKIVSLLDNIDFPHFGENHLLLEITDTNLGTTGLLLTDTRPPVIPEMHHINEFLSHTRELTESDYVLVHCYMGRSRSPAAAIAICIHNGMHWLDAFHHILNIRPEMIPNYRMIRLIDERFYLEGELERYFMYWLYQQKNIPIALILGS